MQQNNARGNIFGKPIQFKYFYFFSAENANQSDITMSDVFHQIDSLEYNETINECVICFERKPEVTLPCAHSYCTPCIEEWYVSIQSICWYSLKKFLL